MCSTQARHQYTTENNLVTGVNPSVMREQTKIAEIIHARLDLREGNLTLSPLVLLPLLLQQRRQQRLGKPLAGGRKLLRNLQDRLLALSPGHLGDVAVRAWLKHPGHLL